MKFPFRVIQGLEDVTKNFEALEGKAILDKLPTSFLQLLSTQKLQLQVGTWSATIGAGGDQGLAINLTTAWPTAHALFLATCNPNNSFTNFLVKVPGVVLSTSQGQCVINNTNAANTSVTGTWLSLGS